MTTGCFVIKHPVFAFSWCKWKGYSQKEMFLESTNRELMVRSKSTASLYSTMFSRKLITARLNSSFVLQSKHPKFAVLILHKKALI